MGVVTVKSTAITNRDATPRTLTDSVKSGARLHEFIGVCAIANGDSVGSKYLFGSIPSNARVSELLVSSPDIGTTTAADFGLYKTTDDGGAVVDADFFTAALSLKDGAISQSIIQSGNVMTLANSEKRIWELLGLSSDPCIMYDVVATLTGAADAAGSVSVKGRFAV